MRVPFLACVWTAISCGLMGCGQGEQREAANEPTDTAGAVYGRKLAASISLLTKSDRPDADFVQALRSQVKLVDGMLVVTQTTSPALWVLSVNSPWVLACGPPLSLVFDGAVNGSSEGVSNAVDVKLSFALLSEDRCEKLAPLLGKEMNLI